MQWIKNSATVDRKTDMRKTSSHHFINFSATSLDAQLIDCEFLDLPWFLMAPTEYNSLINHIDIFM